MPSIVLLWLAEFLDVLVGAVHVHLDILRQDLRYTARTLLRTPGFTLTAILVTGLGIGANTAAFSITDRALIHPLPFADSDRLVQLWQRPPAYARVELSPPNFYDWRRLSTSFEAMSAYSTYAWNFLGQGDPLRLEGAAVTPEFFGILGVRPVLGRVFNKDDARPGAPRTVILSYAFWQSAFGGRSDVLGQTVRLDNDACSVIGVMPLEFIFPARSGQLWIPLVLGDPPREARDNLFLNVIGKLRRGVRIEQARAEMGVIADQLAREYPKENERVGAGVDPLGDLVPNQTRLLLWALFGASFCVLLIACSNLANLLLAKAIARRKELAVRAAMGAGRERLVRQLLTESMLLAIAGGALGIVVAMTSLPLLSAIVPANLPLSDATVLDPRVLIFTGLVTLGTGLLFGVLPALRMCNGADQQGLQEGSRSGVGGRRERLRSALVIAEVTVSLVLLVAAGLLSRALWRVQSIDPGFRADAVVTIQTLLPMPRYALNSTRVAFYNEVLSSVRALPGVSNAAYISSLPMTPGGGIWPVAEPGVLGSGATDTAAMRVASSAYFDTMGIPVRAGRDFNESDTLDAQPVAVVSESFAQRYWPGQNPLGRTFHFAFDNFPFAERDKVVVGVVGDVRFRGLERKSEPQVYLASRQLPDRSATFYAPRALVVRSPENTAALLPSIRRIIQKADPEMPVYAVQPMRNIVDLQTAPRSTQIRLVAVFAVLSLVLAGVGIHGLLSFAVGQRSSEFGVRIALGAQPRDIVSLVLREGIVLAAAGVVLGLVLSYFAGRSIQALLAGVAPLDPATIAACGMIACAMTLSGSLLPALRAMRVDATITIRSE